MKKILIILLAISIQNTAFAGSYIDKQLKEAKKNSKYNTVQKIKRNYDIKPEYSDFHLPASAIKDPKLIKLANYPKVDEKAFQTKLAEDEKIYKKQIMPILAKNMNSINVEPAAVDFYKVYRVAERLIRANNLDYANWRIAIRKTPDDVNAQATAVNFIWINTALYDSLYGDDEALAFVLAHEMSHHILGHQQRMAELIKRFEVSDKYRDILYPNIPEPVTTFQEINLYKESRMMEFMADAEAFILVAKAGYSPNAAMSALNLMDALPNIKYWDSTHPITKDRIKSANENISYLNPDWVNAGKANILNSPVLPCKKSSDRVSIVIGKSNTSKDFYEPENIEQKVTRIAYMNYKQGRMENAIKYFEKANKISPNYANYLYISYANEYLYKASKTKKYLNEAQKAVKKASELNFSDINVQNQLRDLGMSTSL